VRVAAADIGTNSTRLLIADVMDGMAVEVSRQVVVTGLGRGVDAAGVLAEESMARTIEVLRSYGAVIEQSGAERARAVATSATRDAANSAVFLDRAQVALGFRPDVLDGATEARLGFRGATMGIDRPGPYLMIDPGGGSTEFVFGTVSPESVHSVDVGSVRLTERALPPRPADPADLLAAAGVADAVLAAVDLPGTPVTVIGVGGTFTSLSAIVMGLDVYDRNRVHGPCQGQHHPGWGGGGRGSVAPFRL